MNYNALKREVQRLFRGDDQAHALAFEGCLRFNLGNIVKIFGETLKQFFSPVAVNDVPTAKLNGCLDLVAACEELPRVLYLEIIIVIICMRTEAQLLKCNGMLFFLGFLLFFPLFVEKFLVIKDTADRRIRFGRDFHKVKPQIHCVFQRVPVAHNGMVAIGFDHPEFWSINILINTLRVVILILFVLFSDSCIS